MRPKIFITLDTTKVQRRGVPFDAVQLKQCYIDAVIQAGGLPLCVSPSDDSTLLEEMLHHMDGLVVTGGDFDIPPEFYGETASADIRIDPPKLDRTQFEATLVRAALRRDLPILGICGGMQLLGVILGAGVIQDIQAEIPNALDHEQSSSPALPDHPVTLPETSWLAQRLGRREIMVNSTHHQAIKDLPPRLRVHGKSPDGVVEWFELEGKQQVFGAQWHPELLDDEVSRLIYGELVQQAASNR